MSAATLSGVGFPGVAAQSASVRAVLLSDDELAAIGHAAGHPWPRPLSTVATSDPRDLAAATARGYRSLYIRGLADEHGPRDGVLALPTALVTLKPAIMAASVGADFALLPGRDRYELFMLPDGTAAAVTTRPGGIHTVAPIEQEAGWRFFADLAIVRQVDEEVEAPALTILVRGDHGRIAGGVLVSSEVQRISAAVGGGLEPGEVLTIPTHVASWLVELRSVL